MRMLLAEGKVAIPDCKEGQRLAEQLRQTVCILSPGGKMLIRNPRRVGMGHGDLLSAWVLAIYMLAHRKVGTKDEVIPQKDSAEYAQYQAKKQAEWEKKREEADLAAITKKVQKEGNKHRVRLSLWS